MEQLKAFFPLSFNIKDVTALVIRVIIYVVMGAVGGVLIGLLGGVPVLNVIGKILGILLEIYTVGGIVLAFLGYFKVIR